MDPDGEACCGLHLLEGEKELLVPVFLSWAANNLCLLRIAFFGNRESILKTQEFLLQQVFPREIAEERSSKVGASRLTAKRDEPRFAT